MSAEVILCLFAVIIIFENVTCALTVFFNKSLHNPNNFFVLSMALSDLLVGAAFIPAYLYAVDNIVLGTITSCVMFTNVSNITLLTTDRFLAAIKGIGYHPYIKKYYRYMIVVAWFVPAVITIVPFCWRADTGSTYHFVFLFIVQAMVFIVYIFIITVYSYILHLTRTLLWHKKAKKSNTSSYIQERNDHATKLTSPGWTKAECKITKVFSGVCVLFCLTWFPTMYLTTCTLLDREDLIFAELPNIAMYMTSLSSIINPWIYAITKSDFNCLLIKFLLDVKGVFLKCQKKNTRIEYSENIEIPDLESRIEDYHAI